MDFPIDLLKGCSDNILFYCLGGKGYYDTHSGSFELTKNQFAILPAHHFHRYQADINDPWTIYWVHFAGNNLDSYANLSLYRFISLFVFHEVKIKSSPDHDIIADAIRFLKANIHKMLTVEDIAGYFCYSSSHFSALFKNKTRSSPLEYFIQLKIHYTCQILDQSGLRIKEIASKVGYEDPYYFSRLFCKVMGLSPNKYREKKQMPK